MATTEKEQRHPLSTAAKVIRVIRYTAIFSVLGGLGFTYYMKTVVDQKIQSFVSETITYQDPGGFNFELVQEDRGDGFTATGGEMTLYLVNDCEIDKLRLGSLEYSISHLPWNPGRYTLKFEPNEKILRFPSLEGESLNVSGRLTQLTTEIEFEYPEFITYLNGSEQFVTGKGNGKFLLSREEDTGKLSVRIEQPLLNLAYQDERFEFRDFKARVVTAPNGNGELQLVAEKIKSESAYFGSPLVRVEYLLSGVEGRRINLFGQYQESSWQGVYSKDSRFSSSIVVNDWKNFSQAALMIKNTCGGMVADEEARLRIRLAINESIRKGVEINIDSFKVQTEKGPFQMKAKSVVKSDVDQHLVDMHQAFLIDGKVMFPKGFISPQMLRPAVKAGALFENNEGHYLGSFSYRNKSLTLNDMPAAQTNQISYGVFEYLTTDNVQEYFDTAYDLLIQGINPIHRFMMEYSEPDPLSVRPRADRVLDRGLPSVNSVTPQKELFTERTADLNLGENDSQKSDGLSWSFVQPDNQRN